MLPHVIGRMAVQIGQKAHFKLTPSSSFRSLFLVVSACFSDDAAYCSPDIRLDTRPLFCAETATG